MSSSVGKNLFPIYGKIWKNMETYGKIKHVPNHQPAYVCVWELNPYILWKNKSPCVLRKSIKSCLRKSEFTIPTTNIDPTKIQSWKVTCLQKWLCSGPNYHFWLEKSTPLNPSAVLLSTCSAPSSGWPSACKRGNIGTKTACRGSNADGGVGPRPSRWFVTTYDFQNKGIHILLYNKYFDVKTRGIKVQLIGCHKLSQVQRHCC